LIAGREKLAPRVLTPIDQDRPGIRGSTMCGIAGALDLTGTREFSLQRLAVMAGAIAHRGPDDEHFHLEPGLALASRRLSIIDLAGGRQPIGNEDGSVWVAFNGELFEYPELRRELLARGHILATRCDTEAWVHLYEDLGHSMFEKARGQFAVALWDRTSRSLFLGRDRVGICPLYYTEADGWLLWASEIKAILASGLVKARPDPRGVDHLFTFFCAGTTRTFFEGIASLPPGHYLRICEARATKHRYWDLDFPDAGSERRLNDPAPLVEELEALLEQAVERRLRSDVPVVSYISGGLDSTVVLGCCARQRRAAIPAFTIGFDRAGPDERAHAQEAASVLGSPLHTVAMDRAGIAQTFPELIRAAEGPVLDTSCAALLRLAQAVHAQGYKVALTGEGADEALAGYVWYKTQAIRDGVTRCIGPTVPRLFRQIVMRSVAGRRPHLPPEQAMAGVRPAQQDLYELISLAKPTLYSAAMQERLAAHSPYSDLDLTSERIGRWHPLNQSLYVGYKVMLAGLLMICKGDRIAMNASVETRYPYLDDDVIAFCAGIAPEYKLRGRTEKWILRQVAARVLPRRIASRPKTMFRACMSRTFLGPHRPSWVDQLLSPESLRASGYFDPASVARQRTWQVAIPRITPARFVFDVGLTCVVSTQLWHHLFFGGGLCELPTWQPPARRHAAEPLHQSAV
jgi:asparagine synthase (glutamine-hydrolysing)